MTNLRSNTIPWLLLKVVSTEGPRDFANMTCIQSVNSVGSNAFSVNGTVAGQIARVPYTADYSFYRKTSN